MIHFQLEPFTKKWWKHMFLGLLFISLAIWIFITPLASYMSLSLFFTLALALTGIFEIIASLQYRKETKRWELNFMGGILELFIGSILLVNPVLTMDLLPYGLALWFFYKGGKALWVSLRLKSYGIKGWGWTLALGIGILAFAMLITAFPVLGGLSIVYTMALAFVALGMFNFSVAYYLGRFRKKLRKNNDR